MTSNRYVMMYMFASLAELVKITQAPACFQNSASVSSLNDLCWWSHCMTISGQLESKKQLHKPLFPVVMFTTSHFNVFLRVCSADTVRKMSNA
jgi:hypothetical protein